MVDSFARPGVNVNISMNLQVDVSCFYIGSTSYTNDNHDSC